MVVKPIPHWAEEHKKPGDVFRPNESAVWKKLVSLPRPISPPHTLRVKGEDVGTLVFRVLSATELTSVYKAAHEATVESLGEDAKGFVAYEEMYLEQKALHLVALACRQPDDPRFPTFFTAADARDHLTDDEIGVVISAYNIFRRESGPILAEIGDPEAAAWYRLIKQKPNRMALGRCSSEGLIDLVLYAAERMETGDAQSDRGAGPDGAVAPDVGAPTPE